MSLPVNYKVLIRVLKIHFWGLLFFMNLMLDYQILKLSRDWPIYGIARRAAHELKTSIKVVTVSLPISQQSKLCIGILPSRI